MSRKAVFNLLAVVFIVALLGGVWGLIDYYQGLPERVSQHETIVLGQSERVPPRWIEYPAGFFVVGGLVMGFVS